MIVRYRPHDAALSRAIDPDWRWGDLTPLLLAQVADSLAWLVWAKSKDGARNRNQPKPIPRPGVRPERFADTVALPTGEVARRLALPRMAA